MKQKFDDILNDCLERLAAGEDIAACIERYPEHDEELTSLLRIARVTMQVALEVSPVDDAKARVLARVNVRLAQGSANTARNDRKGFSFRGFLPEFAGGALTRPVMIGFAAVFLVLVAAGGSTIAAADSVPGEALYWVKQTGESVSLQIPRSDEGRAKAHANLAVVRGQEMRLLISRGRFFDAERAGLRMRYHLNLSADHIGILLAGDPMLMTPRPAQVRTLPSAVGLRQVLVRDESTVKAHLTSLLREAPPTHQIRLRRIIYQTDYGYRILIQAIDERNSLAPGKSLNDSAFVPPAQ